MRWKRLAPVLMVGVFLTLAIPASAGSRIEKTLALNPDGRFVLEAEGGSVSLYGSNESGAEIVITSDRDDLNDIFEFSFEENPGLVRVRSQRRNHWSWFDSFSLHYDVRVPKNTVLEIRTSGGRIEVGSIGRDADLRTSGGSITVSGLNGRLLAHTSGGPIQVKEIEGNAELQTSGGGIDATSVDGSLFAHTSGGPIHLERITGRIDAHTSGGGITAVLSKNNFHGGAISSSGGSISVAVDPAANLEINASTSGGSVRSDLPIRVTGEISRHSLHGTLNSGGATLDVHTSGGSIHLAAL
jgi:DUF4097 and DUF4098 domain-containing protein YvlB